MKKTMQKAVLTALFPIALCSCWNDFGTQTEEKKIPRISILLSAQSGSPMTGERAEEVRSAIENYTQTDVQFYFLSYDNYSRRLAEVLKNPADLPMIIQVEKLDYNVAEAVKNGAFWNLQDFIWDEKKYPNLSKMKKEVAKTLVIDSSLIGVYRAQDLGRYGFSYRKDWADKLGLSEPKTAEDVYNMLYAFTYGDPDGNGRKDTFGLSMCRDTTTLDIIQTWFGCGNGWVELSNSLVPVHQTQEYLQALDWLRKLHQDRLIISDWQNRTQSTWKNQVTDGFAGVYVGDMEAARRISDQFIAKNVQSVTDSGKKAELKLVGAINGKTKASAGYDGFLAITHSARNRAQVEDCLHFLDKMNDSEMMILAEYGLKDFNYKVDGAILTDIDIGNPEIARCYNSLSGAVSSIPNLLRDIEPHVKISDSTAEEYRVVAKNADFAVLNPATAYLASSKAYEEKHAELDKIIEDARIQYIIGEISRDTLSAELNRWYERGGKEVIAEVNSLYKTRLR